MSSVGAGFRLARAGWVLVREGVVAALPGEELSGLPKFGWRLARLFTRRRALSYERGMSAPVCVAKGADNIALKIREIARENDIPIVENVPLARALYATVDVDDEIPVEHYHAVAEIIGYVMGLKRGLSGRRL